MYVLISVTLIPINASTYNNYVYTATDWDA